MNAARRKGGPVPHFLNAKQASKQASKSFHARKKFRVQGVLQ